MASISNDIHIILEEFIKKHAIIEDLPDKKTTLNIISGVHKSNKHKHNVVNKKLKPMSPKGLYRAKGLNITNYHRIMNKYGLQGHNPESKSKNSFTAS